MDHSLRWHLREAFLTSHKNWAFPFHYVLLLLLHTLSARAPVVGAFFAMVVTRRELKNGIGVILIALGGMVVIL